MNIVIIPARGGSKSILKKNIIDFCGKPLIAWSIEQSLRSERVDKVFVTTDCEEIAAVSEKYGAEIIMRPDELATDFSSSEDALKHAVKEIAKQTNLEKVVFLQCTSPVRRDFDIDEAIKEMDTQNADSLFSCSVTDDLTLWEKYPDGSIDSISYDYRNRGRRQDRNELLIENGSIYIFKPELLDTDNNRLGGKIAYYHMPIWTSFEIDHPEDLEITAFYMKKYILQKEGLSLSKSQLELIVYDFDGVMTDNRVIVSEDGTESVSCNRSDGLGVEIIRDKMDIPQMILSKEKNHVVRKRAEKLKIEIMHGVDDKKSVLENYCIKNNINLKNVLYIGNDINDVEVMKAVGYALCPADSYDEAKDAADMVMKTEGGKGVIRELINYIK